MNKRSTHSLNYFPLIVCRFYTEMDGENITLFLSGYNGKTVHCVIATKSKQRLHLKVAVCYKNNNKHFCQYNYICLGNQLKRYWLYTYMNIVRVKLLYPMAQASKGHARVFNSVLLSVLYVVCSSSGMYSISDPLLICNVCE